MSTFNNIAKGIGIGAAVLGASGYFFPETTGYLTGGMVGSSAIGTNADGSTMYGGNPQFMGYDYPSFGGASATESALGIGGGAAKSGMSALLTNPTFATAGLLSLTSLLGNMFGSDPAEEQLDFEKQKYADSKTLSADALAQQKEQFAQEMAYKYAALKAAGGGAGSAAAAQKEIAAKNRRAQMAMQRIENNQQMTLAQNQNRYRGPDIVARARDAQVQAAQNTGNSSSNFFNMLTQNLQRPLLRA